jgi:hypothetical protein
MLRMTLSSSMPSAFFCNGRVHTSSPILLGRHLSKMIRSCRWKRYAQLSYYSKNRKYTIKEKDTEVCVGERELFRFSVLSDIHSSFLRTTPHVLHRGWDLSATAGHQDRLQKGPSPHRVFHILCPALSFSACVFNEGDARLRPTFAASDTRWKLGNNGPNLNTRGPEQSVGNDGQLLFLFPALWQE